MRIRAYEIPDEQAVVALWQECGLTRPWNDPRRDIARKLTEQPELFLVGTFGGAVISTAMVGFDGHRGWVYYLAVAPRYRGRSFGRMLMHEAERLLIERGCPKLNLQVRTSNTETIEFYRKLGYIEDDTVSFGRRLIPDCDAQPDATADDPPAACAASAPRLSPALGVMRNPWLDIPLADYESHMALPDIGQARLLSDVFATALSKHAPRSVAVLGCAGGNGFDRIAREVTERVVGVDINPDYVLHARTRFDHRIPLLELLVGDVQKDELAFAPVELVFVGLLLEYVDAETVLAKIRGMLRPGGTLLTVVQLPSTTIAEITPSPFASLGALSSVMHLVPPKLLSQLAAAHGYHEIEAQTLAAANGKEFQIQSFRLAMPHHRLQPTPAGGRD